MRPITLVGRGVHGRALTPTERLVEAAQSRGLETEPFRELARAYSEHLYSAAPEAEVVQPYRDALLEFRKVPRWRRLLGAINPASLLILNKEGLARRARRARSAKAPRCNGGRSPW